MHRNRQGSALLMVLWLSAALSAVAFSVSTTVRAEIERASTSIDGVRTYYLAAGAIERTLLHAEWGDGDRNPDGSAKYIDWKRPVEVLNFPTGVAVVEMIPESSKLNVNKASPEELGRLLLALGVPPREAAGITSAIVESRSAGGQKPPFALFSDTDIPSFPPRHASFEEIEDLLMVPGITPDLFYGTYYRSSDGRLQAGTGLRDCVTTYGLDSGFDINTVQPAVLMALGADPAAVARLVQARSVRPIKPQELNDARDSLGPAAGHVQVGGNVIYTFRATARLRLPDGRLNDLERSVAAMVRSNEDTWSPKIHVLRWYDNAGGERMLFHVWPQ